LIAVITVVSMLCLLLMIVLLMMGLFLKESYLSLRSCLILIVILFLTYLIVYNSAILINRIRFSELRLLDAKGIIQSMLIILSIE
jgi:hypothetical protein